MHVESVAWITERKNVLSGLFAFSALLAFLRATAIDRPALRRRASTGACTVRVWAVRGGVAEQDTTCALPAVLLLLAWWKRGTIERRVVWLTAPLFALGAAHGGGHGRGRTQ